VQSRIRGDDRKEPDMKLGKASISLAAALVVLAIAVPVAQAGEPSPSLLNALETRGQALDNLCGSVTLTGAAYRAVCGTSGVRSRMTNDQLRALEIRGQGMDQLCADKGRLSTAAYAALCRSGGLETGQFTQVLRPSGFHWGDFGIGAASMLGVALLAGGLAAGAHYGRRGGVRSRPVP
jgi:hypothetical protein